MDHYADRPANHHEAHGKLEDANSESIIDPGTVGPTQNWAIANLIQDIWLRILPTCGIRGVLAMGQTCKHLRALCCDKSVWIELIRNLEARLFLDLPPDIQLPALSTSELVSLARRTLRGPRTWSLASGCAPAISRTYRLHPQISLGPGILSWENEAVLLRGGKFILFNNWRKLECWSVVEDRLVWTHKSGYSGTAHPHVLKFAADVVDGGKAATIALCQRTFGSQHRKNLVEIVRLNFVTETSELILCTSAPHTQYDNPFIHPKICGDLVTVGMHGMDQALLIKVSTAEKMLLAPGQYEITVIEGHLVIATVDLGFGTVNVDVVAEASLTPFWKPTTNASSPEPRQGQALWEEEEEYEEEDGAENEDEQSPGAMWKVYSAQELRREIWATIEIPDTRLVRQHSLSVHECPMMEGGEYTVWAYVSSCQVGGPDGDFDSNTEMGDADHSTIFKFRLKLRAGPDNPSLRLLNKVDVDCVWPIHEISYAGHTSFRDYYADREQYVLALAKLQSDGQGERSVERSTEDNGRSVSIQDQVDDCGNYVHMSAYSGALTYATCRELVVNYYE